MIYCPGRFLFVHIPRCKGFSVTQAIASQVSRLPELICVTTGLHTGGAGDLWTHSRACTLQGLPGFDRAFKWAVIRNPWDLVASTYRWYMTMWEAMESVPGPAQNGAWKDVYVCSRLSFTEWIPYSFSYLGGCGGFWKYWACRPNGSELGFLPVRFDRLDDEWEGLCHRMGIPGTPLPHVNQMHDYPADWTPEAVETVSRMCRDDIVRFDFEPPEVT